VCYVRLLEETGRNAHPLRAMPHVVRGLHAGMEGESPKIKAPTEQGVIAMTELERLRAERDSLQAERDEALALAEHPDISDLKSLAQEMLYRGMEMLRLQEELAELRRVAGELAGGCVATERAHASLFGQCLSNPVFNTWGKDVNLRLLNEAYELSIAALAEYAKLTEAKS
jgi:hypothetical protein